MTFYGLSSYDKCIKLLEVWKGKNVTELTSQELAKDIARYIGGSLIYKTVRNYISIMAGFNMIVKNGKDTYKVNYEALDDQ